MFAFYAIYFPPILPFVDTGPLSSLVGWNDCHLSHIWAVSVFRSFTLSTHFQVSLRKSCYLVSVLDIYVFHIRLVLYPLLIMVKNILDKSCYFPLLLSMSIKPIFRTNSTLKLGERGFLAFFSCFPNIFYHDCRLNSCYQFHFFVATPEASQRDFTGELILGSLSLVRLAPLCKLSHLV